MEISNYNWLAQRTPLQRREWHIISFIRKYEVENYSFYKSTYESYWETINIDDVKGVNYVYGYNDNNDINWAESLNMLYRFEDIRKNKKTYHSLIDHAQFQYNEPKTVSRYGNTLITKQGQHRMTLCKFLELETVEVEVME